MIRFAVVGTGWVAKEYLKAIRANPDAELYAVVTSDEARARERLKEFGMEARIFLDFEEAVKDPAIDAVVLCSTPDLRPEQAVRAAQFNKHMILEKPLCLEESRLQHMADAIESAGVQTVVSFVLRWNPTLEMIQAQLADDAIGRVFMAQIDYWNHIGPHFPQYRWSAKKRLGGSNMMSAGCHAVDALRYFAGEITEVTAYGASTWAHSDYEFEPNVIALCKLKNGGIGKVSSSLECVTPYKFNIHLLGEKGSIMNNRIFSHKFPGQTDYAVIPTLLPESGDVSLQPFHAEVAEFVEAIRGEKRTRCDFFDAVKTMQVCFAIDKSLASGETVVLDH